MNNLSYKRLRIQFKTAYVSVIFPETDQKMASKSGRIEDISTYTEVQTFAEKRYRPVACIFSETDLKVFNEL
jgi:hypothetical protein